MDITKIEAKAFWKGEVGIRGQVREKEKLYNIRLEVKGSYVNSYSCSCNQENSSNGICAHAKALFAYYQEQSALNPNQPISTSSQVRAMIREYTNGEVAEILQENREFSIKFVPKLFIGHQELHAEFRLGRERLYVLKDLEAFARAMEQGAYVEYGKNLAFHHSVEAFAQESREILELVLELISSYREYYQQFHKNLYSSVLSLRELNISPSNRDRFFNLLVGKEVEFENPKGIQGKLEVVHDNPEGMAIVRKIGRQGITISLDKELFSFCGEKYLYILKDKKLYICDERFSKDAEIFFKQMTQGYGAPYQVTVNTKDIPLFYERVLKRLEKYGLIEAGDMDFEQIRPPKLKARFEVESSGPEQIILHPTLSYGDYSFHPVEDEKVPKTICRDVPKEFRISQILTKYFKYKDPQTKDLMIQNDEEALFLFLSKGIYELKALGQVYFPEEEQYLKVLESQKVSVGVQVAEGWLELSIDAGDMTGTDLMKILEAYRQKKHYYRLKNGEFLKLEDNGLVAVAQIIDSLALSKKELRLTKIKIPKYRALYLDSLCKGREDILFTRDQIYKSIVRGMKLVDDSDFEVPEELSHILRGYQKTGFKWLKTLDSWGFGGILADDMGLGKTIQIISVLVDECHKESKKDRDSISASLVICPASLVYNWEYEFESFAPSMKVLVVTGNSQEREEKIRHIEEFDVAITSYDLLRRDLPFYEPYHFRFEIIDEAQYIKNPDTQNAKAVKLIQSDTRYALTGTPVENRLSELWSIFDYLLPGFLYSYRKFKRDYEVPIIKEGDKEALKRLQQITAPFILRRLKEDVLKELPKKLETIVYSKMEQEQKELYLANAWILKKNLQNSSKFQILAALTKIRQVCCDPRLIYEDYHGGSAKLETCMELILSGTAAGHKILLFSQFTSMLQLIGERIATEEIKFYLLTGETPKEERIRLVNAFQKDDVKVFLISLKAGGTGLNLTAADMVIHYDPWWNVAAQNQATDRTHRIGQEKQVSVFQLITKDTVEENILKLQKAKEILAEEVVSEGMVSLGSLSQEQLKNLLD